MTTLPVTTVAAALLALLFFRLSFAVIKFRRQHKVSLGSGGHEDLERAIRAQGNFAEYVPISLILIACLELNGAPWWMAAATGLALVLGRLLHARGMQGSPSGFRSRILGMQFTLLNLLTLAALNLGWVVMRMAG